MPFPKFFVIWFFFKWINCQLSFNFAIEKIKWNGFFNCLKMAGFSSILLQIADNGIFSSVKNTQNATKFIGPICQPKSKSFGYHWKKTSLGVRSSCSYLFMLDSPLKSWTSVWVFKLKYNFDHKSQNKNGPQLFKNILNWENYFY